MAARHTPNIYSREMPAVALTQRLRNDLPGPVARHGQAGHRRSAACGTARPHCAASEAGFDLIYVYAGHDLSIFQHFISRRHNSRTDEYGGGIENRVRLSSVK